MREGLDDWYRVGGSRLQFYALDDEIAELLEERLRPDFGPRRGPVRR